MGNDTGAAAYNQAVILVTGMHRGGTSLLANLLFELGVPMGDPEGFYAANQWNPRGYFEQADMLDYNNRVVTGQPFFPGGFRRQMGQVRYLLLQVALF